MVQFIERPAVDFRSGHGLTVCEIEPCDQVHVDSVELA